MPIEQSGQRKCSVTTTQTSLPGYRHDIMVVEKHSDNGFIHEKAVL